jgi:gamma-glutamyl phosphate reductase
MYIAYIVKRTQIYLDDSQDARLARRAAAAGKTKSSLIREAIEAYLVKADAPHEQLARLREAVDQLGRTPLTLEDGRSYVERVRALDLRRQVELDRQRR